MTLDMDAPPGEGAALLHRHARRASVRPDVERGDLRVTGHIPHHLDGIYVYMAPHAEEEAVIHSLRLHGGRVYWSRHLWAGLGRALQMPMRGPAEPRRYSYKPVAAEDWTDPDADLTRLSRMDLWTGQGIERDFGEAAMVSAFCAVPKRDDAPEDEAWLMGFVYDGGHGTSTFYILDAATLATQARIAMPEPVSAETYGSWIADLR